MAPPAPRYKDGAGAGGSRSKQAKSLFGMAPTQRLYDTLRSLGCAVALSLAGGPGGVHARPIGACAVILPCMTNIYMSY